MEGTIQYLGKEQMIVPKEGQHESTFFFVTNKHQLQKRETDLEIGVYLNGKRKRTIHTSFLGYIE